MKPQESQPNPTFNLRLGQSVRSVLFFLESKKFIGLVLLRRQGFLRVSQRMCLIWQAFTKELELLTDLASFVRDYGIPVQNRIGGNVMRFRTALCMASLFLVFFTVAAWSAPSSARDAAGSLAPTPDSQSLTGKISSVGDAAFTLEVRKNQDVSNVQFSVDDNTKVEGQLAVGAHATVEYRSNDGKNVAVHVVVTPASGIHLY
jgi:Domain of unknown function (DUF5666)